MAEAIKINESDFQSLKGKVVLVTGASSGIGLATCDYFYSLGCSVAYIAGRKKPPTENPLDSDRTMLRNVDVSNWEQQADAFEAVHKKFGRIDIVVPNAGCNEPANQYFELKKDDNGRLKPLNLGVYDVDLKGTCYTVALGIHYLTEGGSIVMMTSLAGYAGVPEMPNYSAAKHAATGLLRSLAGPCKKKNIALSLVGPHITYTPGTFPDYEPGETKFKQMYEAMLPLGFKMSRAITCAHATAWLVAQGMSASGEGLLIENDEINALESDLEKTYSSWFRVKRDTKDAAGAAADSKGRGSRRWRHRMVF